MNRGLAEMAARSRLPVFLLLAVALVALAALFAHAAPSTSAQEEQSAAAADIVLVGNFGQDSRLSDWSTNNFVLTQAFTTGNAAATLSSIEASIGETLNASPIATVRAELWSAAEGGRSLSAYGLSGCRHAIRQKQM